MPIRSMALRFALANGQQWRTGMNSMPVFPVATAAAGRLAGDPETGGAGIALAAVLPDAGHAADRLGDAVGRRLSGDVGTSLRLPPIFPANAVAFAVLHHLHGEFAMLLSLTFLAHMAAALYQGLIRRDGVLPSMLRGRRKMAPALIGYIGPPAPERPNDVDAERDATSAAKRTD